MEEEYEFENHYISEPAYLEEPVFENKYIPEKKVDENQIYFLLEDSRLLKYLQEYEMEDEEIESIISEEGCIPLNVIRDSGFEVTPDYKIVVNDLSRGTNNIAYKQFYNRGNGGVKFKIKIIIGKNETWYSQLYQTYKDIENDEHKVTTLLNEIIETLTPVKVVTNAIDIPNDNYIITDNPSRKQTFETYTEWELEFTTYNPAYQVVYKNDNTRVQKAIKSAKAKQVKANKKSSNTKSTYKTKLNKCKTKDLVYSKKKKDVKCVEYLQRVLKQYNFYTTGKVDGWFNVLTKEAVKKFQKKFGLKQTGTVNADTLYCLVNGKKKKSTAKSVKSTVKKASKTVKKAVKKVK